MSANTTPTDRHATQEQGMTEPTTSHPANDQPMQAIVQTQYGTSDTWSVGQIDRPTIGADEVLVEVRAAGLDRGTWHLMAGYPYAVRMVMGLRGPKNPVPGLDVAGVVTQIGRDVTRFSVGDEVFGIGKSSFAQFAAAREHKLALKPASLTFAQAAALPVSGSTALSAVIDVGGVRSGDNVLIIGASGGVGTYAVQLAKALGAKVTGVCSAGKAALVRSLGADHVIDYAREDFADGATKYDVIIDIAGNSSVSRLRGALTPKGTLAIVGGEEGGPLTGGMDRQLRALVVSAFVGQKLAMVLPKEHYSLLERLNVFVDNGSVVPAVERTYPLQEAATAMRQLETGLVRGKLVITM